MEQNNAKNVRAVSIVIDDVGEMHHEVRGTLSLADRYAIIAYVGTMISESQFQNTNQRLSNIEKGLVDSAQATDKVAGLLERLVELLAPRQREEIEETDECGQDSSSES